MQLLIATHNHTKVARIKGILDSLNGDLELLTLDQFNIQEIDEPYDTFAENALHKAQFYAQQTGLNTLSEDSGLCINALNGFPGVRTKEFRVASGSIEQACLELQQRLKPHTDQSAYFICSACIVLPKTSQILTAEGRLNGTISTQPFKDLGFDFERIFIPIDHTQTLGEMNDKDKSAIGHRFKAISNVYQQLLNQI